MCLPFLEYVPRARRYEGFHILLIFRQLYDTETQVSLAVKPKAFLGAALFVNLHCTVPDALPSEPSGKSAYSQCRLSRSNEEFSYLCRVYCLKYWVGRKVHADFFFRNVVGNKDSMVSRQVL